MKTTELKKLIENTIKEIQLQEKEKPSDFGTTGPFNPNMPGRGRGMGRGLNDMQRQKLYSMAADLRASTENMQRFIADLPQDGETEELVAFPWGALIRVLTQKPNIGLGGDGDTNYSGSFI